MPPSTIMTTDADRLPAAPGAYLLLIRLDRIVDLPPIFKGRSLPEGRYVYAGSAYGPGGIRARCRRHLTRRDVRHWHVDWLTHAANEISVAAFPGERECGLIKRLSQLTGARFPLNGFGSSDCRRCEAHLLELEAPEIFEAFCEKIHPDCRR